MYFICPVLVALGSPFASRFPWVYIWVSTLYRPSFLCMSFSAKLINKIMIMIIILYVFNYTMYIAAQQVSSY